MLSVSLFGKGGIGKSTIACNLSAAFAKRGLSVAQIGCDPKADSVSRLVQGRAIPRIIDTLLAQPGKEFQGDLEPSLVVEGLWGVACLESGGPEPGIGCAGRGIDLALNYLKRTDFFDGKYDVVILDVLGDVVCGGFAAPLRKGVGQDVCIVTSEEMISLYAANNIARMVRNHAATGARLLGLVINCRSQDPPLEMLEAFAERLQTRILAVLPLDPLLRAASDRYRTVVEEAPDAPITASFEELSRAIADASRGATPEPQPMGDEAFTAFINGYTSGGAAPTPLESPSTAPPEQGATPAPDPAAGEIATSKSEAGEAWHEGGARARRRIAKQIKLVAVDDVQGRGGTTSVDHVYWHGREGLVVELVGAAGEVIRVMLGPLRDEGYFRQTSDWAMWYELSGIHDGQRRLLAKWLDRLFLRLRRLSLDELVGEVADDTASTLEALPAIGRPPATRGSPPPVGADEQSGAPTPADEGSDSNGTGPTEEQTLEEVPIPDDSWRSFLDARIMADMYAREIQLDFGLTRWQPMIRFGDLECQKPSVTRQLSWPIDQRLLVEAERRAVRRTATLREDITRKVYFADLDHGDMITGSALKLETMVEEMLGGDHAELFRFENCCVPIVTGESVRSTLEAIEEGTDAVVHYHTPARPHSHLVKYFSGQIEAARRGALVEDTCNLVGFADSPATASLVQLLAGVGLTLHQQVIPGPFSGDPEAFLDAALTVVRPNAHYEHFYPPVIACVGDRLVEAGAPYGVAGTQRWLATIAARAGKEALVETAWREASARYLPRWQRLCRATPGIPLGLLIDLESLSLLTEPSLLGGLDILGFLQEAGFPVEVVTPRPRHHEHHLLVTALQDRLGEDRIVTLLPRRSWKELIRDRGYRAVVSNRAFEPHLDELGVGRVSVFAFELGLQGAVETVEHILHVCAVGFHRNYREYLTTP